MSVYASNCKTSALGPDERHRMEKELKKLKEMLSIHLDLIQHQADQAASRETQFKALRRENDLLLQKMERMERRLSVPARPPGASPPPAAAAAAAAVAAAAAPAAPATPATAACVDSATSPLPPIPRASQHTQTSDDEPERPAPPARRPIRARARRSSPPAAAASESPGPSAQPAASHRPQRKLYRKGDEPARHRKCMLTESEYHQYIPVPPPEESDSEEAAGRARIQNIEIPRWTLNPLLPLPTPDPAESTDDAVFAKRHLKLELDEKRRKRWDLQRLREQRAYEKLKQSYSRGRSGRSSTEQSEPGRPLTLRPPASGALYLQVSPQLPVCAFGSNLPVLVHREFRLPWSPGKAPSAPGGRR